MSPDLILHNAQVVVGDGRDAVDPTSPTAVAVRGDRIETVGHEDLVEAATADTRIIDLGGRTLMPGINDGHLHMGGWVATSPPAALDLSPTIAPTVASIVALIAERVRATPPGTWIRGRGWIANGLSDLPGPQPTAALLDDVAPDHPVALTDFSGHALWTNTCAMKIAGVDRTAKVSHGGVMHTDGTGEPTGLFAESATALVASHIPPLDDAELEAALRAGLSRLHQQGITSITDAALNPLPGGESWLGGLRVFEILQRICSTDDVRMRTNVLLTFSPPGSTLLDSTRSGLEAYRAQRQDRGPQSDPSWFNVRGLKVFADGVPPNCTAWMHQAYPDGGHGCLTISGDTDADRIDELHEILRTGHSAGLQIGVHVTGDRATEAVVSGFEATLADAAPSASAEHRHYLIHGPLAMPDVLARAGAMGLGVNVQPFLKATSAPAIEELFGREMADYQWPLRTILGSGCKLASSSDAPITEPNWRAGIATAMLRETPSGEVFGPQEMIGAAETIASYTSAGAWQDGAETWKGTIEPGMVADLCVVDGRLLTDDPRSMADMDVSMTFAGGAIVHDTLTV